MRIPCATALASLALALAACVDPSLAPDPEQVLREATLALQPPRCAGVVVGDGSHALTAAHCVGDDEWHLAFTFFDGRQTEGEVVAIDRAQDLALVRLAQVAPVRPLVVAPELPVLGTPLVFVGNNVFMHPLQHLQLERIGQCPSLPDAAGVLFTTLRGQPGDSGAPVVDDDLRVVGLVHGGAACRIAAPVAPFAVLVPALRQARKGLSASHFR